MTAQGLSEEVGDCTESIRRHVHLNQPVVSNVVRQHTRWKEMHAAIDMTTIAKPNEEKKMTGDSDRSQHRMCETLRAI